MRYLSYDAGRVLGSSDKMANGGNDEIPVGPMWHSECCSERCKVEHLRNVHGYHVHCLVPEDNATVPGQEAKESEYGKHEGESYP